MPRSDYGLSHDSTSDHRSESSTVTIVTLDDLACVWSSQRQRRSLKVFEFPTGMRHAGRHTGHFSSVGADKMQTASSRKTRRYLSFMLVGDTGLEPVTSTV